MRQVCGAVRDSKKDFELERPSLSCLTEHRQCFSVKFAFWGNLNFFFFANSKHTETKQIATHKDFTLRGCRMDVNSSFKSLTVHCAYIPFSPTSSEHEQPPVQLLAKASERAAWQSTTARTNKDQGFICEERS